MAITVKMEGLRELEQAMKDLTKAAGRGVMRRSLKKSAEPMREIAYDLAPRGESSQDDLAEGIAISSRLSKRQASMHRRMFRDTRSSVEMFLGPGPDPAAWNQEFGNVNHGPQPFMRPAWDQDHRAMLERLSSIMRVEVDKAVARAARKAARQAAKR